MPAASLAFGRAISQEIGGKELEKALQQIEKLKGKAEKEKKERKKLEKELETKKIPKPSYKIENLQDVKNALVDLKGRLDEEYKAKTGVVPDDFLIDLTHVLKKMGKLPLTDDEKLIDDIQMIQRNITDLTFPKLDFIKQSHLVPKFLKSIMLEVGGEKVLAPAHSKRISELLRKTFTDIFSSLSGQLVKGARKEESAIRDLEALAKDIGAEKELNEQTDKHFKKQAKKAIEKIPEEYENKIKEALVAHWADYFFEDKNAEELKKLIEDVSPPELIEGAKKKAEKKRKVRDIPEELKAIAGEKYGALLSKLPKATLNELLFAFRENPEGIKKMCGEFEKSVEELTSFKLRKKVLKTSPLSALATKLVTLFTDRMALQATTKDDYNSEADGVYPDYRKFVLNEIEKGTTKREALKKMEEGISNLLNKGTTYWQGIDYLTWLEAIPEEERKQRVAKWIDGSYELPVQTDPETAEKLIEKGGKRATGEGADKKKSLIYVMLPIEKWIPAFVHEIGRKIEEKQSSITKEELEEFLGKSVDDEVLEWVNKDENRKKFEEYKKKVDSGVRTKGQIHGDIKRQAGKK